jgi:hypothetical protein
MCHNKQESLIFVSHLQSKVSNKKHDNITNNILATFSGQLNCWLHSLVWKQRALQ